MGRSRVTQELSVSDATDSKGGDPIPAQGSLAPDYVSWVETRIILGYGLRAGVTSCIVIEASRAREGREARRRPAVSWPGTPIGGGLVRYAKSVQTQ